MTMGSLMMKQVRTIIKRVCATSRAKTLSRASDAPRRSSLQQSAHGDVTVSARTSQTTHIKCVGMSWSDDVPKSRPNPRGRNSHLVSRCYAAHHVAW